MNKNILKWIATLGPVGFLPYAPGTYGTCVAFVLVVLFKPVDLFLFMIFLLFLLIGLLASEEAEKTLGEDSGQIVIDEFCGFLLSIIFLPREAPYLVAAFILFRLFDIIKPPPIKRIERVLPGGMGVMADDLVAAVYTNICLQIAGRFFG